MFSALPEKRQKTWVILFFVALTLTGLWMGKDYGVPWDERSEQKILVMNIYEYAYRLLGEEHPLVQLAESLGASPISQDIERDHGVAPFYPLAPIFFIEDGHLYTQIWHAYIWLLFMLGVVSLYALAREMGLSRVLSGAASLLLYLSPRFFAEGHYNNKDVVLLCLTLCIFALAARLMRTRKMGTALLFALAGAFATNVKIAGGFAWGLASLAVLARWRCEGKLLRKEMRMIVAVICTFCAAYFLITPAMWSEPLAFIRYLFENSTHFKRWDGIVFFDGAYYRPAHGSPLPWYYLPKLILTTLPVPYLLLFAAGQVYAGVLCTRDSRLRPLLLALSALWIVPFVAAILLKPVIYNGWRHFYFIYAGIAPMGAIGLYWLSKLVCKKKLLVSISALALGTVFLTQAISMGRNHPYQYVYYNALAGNVDGVQELDYWSLSTYNAMEELAGRKDRNTEWPLVCSRPPTLPHIYPMTNNYDALPETVRELLTYTDEYEDAPYLIYNVNYIRMAGMDAPQGYRELFSIQAYGYALTRVYEKE